MAKKNRILLLLIAAGIAIMVMPACKDAGKKKPDVSGYEVHTDIQRLEDRLMQVSSLEEYRALDVIDSLFIAQYKTQIMGAITGEGHLQPAETAKAFSDFASHPEMRDLHQTIQKTFPSLEDEESALSEAFTYFNFYFKDRPIPRIYSFISPFIYATATSEETLGIGLDMYLGPSFEPYRSPLLQQRFPQYRINRCRRDYIVPNAMKAWLYKEFEIDSIGGRLIDDIIYEGKILYAMDLLLPELNDSIKINYSAGQIEWCSDNEFAIWNNLIENELIFSNEYQRYAGLITDGPFSKGINVPANTPPMIARWTGWQIVRKYMVRNPEISLKELMENNDVDLILKESSYKP